MCAEFQISRDRLIYGKQYRITVEHRFETEQAINFHLDHFSRDMILDYHPNERRTYLLVVVWRAPLADFLPDSKQGRASSADHGRYLWRDEQNCYYGAQ